MDRNQGTDASEKFKLIPKHKFAGPRLRSYQIGIIKATTDSKEELKEEFPTEEKAKV